MNCLMLSDLLYFLICYFNVSFSLFWSYSQWYSGLIYTSVLRITPGGTQGPDPGLQCTEQVLYPIYCLQSYFTLFLLVSAILFF